jgi:hypothetical protein
VRSLLFYFFLLLLIVFQLTGYSFSAETNLVKDARLISCGYYLGSQTPEHATDGNNSTYWSCGILHNQWGEHWLIFDFGGLAEITKFCVKHGAVANLPGTLNTQEFVIEAGPSLDGPWRQVFSIQNTTQENQNEYIFPQKIQSRYIRLYILKPNYLGRDDNFVRIAEVEFWGTKLQSNFNLIASVQAATPDTDTGTLDSVPSINVTNNNSSAKPKTRAPKNSVINQVQLKQEPAKSAGINYSDYLLYGAMGLGALILLVILGSLIRWIFSRQKIKKQLQQKQDAEQIRLQKQQEAEKVKLEKQQAVAAKFQEYFDSGMKAMEEERYEDAAQAFYQAQGLRPDSTEAKSKLVYCKNLMKSSKRNAEQAA